MRKADDFCCDWRIKGKSFLWFLISGRILDDEDSGQKDDFSIHKVCLAFTCKAWLNQAHIVFRKCTPRLVV